MSVKNFIKSTLVLSMLVVSIPSFAQQQMPQKNAEERAQRQTQWMQKNLMLTEEQNKKVYAILLYHATQADDVKTMPPGGEKRAEAKDIKRNKEADLKAVLSPDQYNKYQQHVEEMRERRMQQRGGGMENERQ